MAFRTIVAERSHVGHCAPRLYIGYHTGERSGPMPNAHIRGQRKLRLENEWSILNSRLGGYIAKEHPACLHLQRYIRRAPYGAPCHQWHHFRDWMYERVHRP